MKRFPAFLALVVVTFAMVGCGQSASRVRSDQDRPQLSSESGLSSASLGGKGPIEALALANEWMGNGVTTFVTTQAVKFEFADGEKASVALPADELVIAIAPYFDRTHPCEIHYMSGCQGELVGVPVDVVASLSDGTVLVDETITTMANGFIELWLPRDVEVSLRMATGGKSVSGTIGTFADSHTCITTLQLL